MTAQLEAQRVLNAYRDLAAAGYPGGAQAFSELADRVQGLLAHVGYEQRLPALIVLNAFHKLSEAADGAPLERSAAPPVSPELHATLMSALKFLVHGGEPARSYQLSQQLVRTFPHATDKATGQN